MFGAGTWQLHGCKWADFFLFFVCQGKTTRPNDWRAKGDDRHRGGEIGAKDRDVSSSPSFSRTDAGKQTRQVGANLRSVSITLLLRSPAAGDQCGWRRRALPMNNCKKKPNKLWMDPNPLPPWSCCVGTKGGS